MLKNTMNGRSLVRAILVCGAMFLPASGVGAQLS